MLMPSCMQIAVEVHDQQPDPRRAPYRVPDEKQKQHMLPTCCPGNACMHSCADTEALAHAAHHCPTQAPSVVSLLLGGDRRRHR